MIIHALGIAIGLSGAALTAVTGNYTAALFAFATAIYSASNLITEIRTERRL